MATLRSVWAWLAILTLIILWLPLLAVIRLFDRDPAYYRTGRWFRRLGYALARVNPSWKVEVSGERITDPRRPYVVVCNHQSNGDIPIICYLPWEMKWVAKLELFKVPIVGWMMRLAGDIPVDRTNKLSRARVLVLAQEYLQKKCSVIFFPEGTRSRDGRVSGFTEGPFRLAIRLGVPVLPLVLDGTSETLPKHSWKFGQADHIRLKVLPPVETTGMKVEEAGLLRDRVRQVIVDQLAGWRGVSPLECDAAPAPRTDISDRQPS